MRQEYLFLDDTQKERVEGYQYKNVKKTVHSYSTNSFWEVIFEQTGESEKIAQTLSALHTDFTAKFSPIVLTDESSAYYNKKLYPKFNLFERELRKLLYLKRAQLKDSDVDKAINDLEKMDFGTIFIVLFTDKDFCNQCTYVY